MHWDIITNEELNELMVKWNKRDPLKNLTVDLGNTVDSCEDDICL